MPARYWTYDLCDEAYRIAGRRRAVPSGAYFAAVREGWHEELSRKHCKPVGNKKQRMVYEIVNPQAGLAYVGLTWNWFDRMKTYYEKMHNEHEARVLSLLYHPGTVLHMSELMSEQEAALLEDETIDSYIDRGFYVLNTKRGGGLGSSERVYTQKKLESLKGTFTTRRDLERANPALYKCLQSKGLLDWFFEGAKDLGRMRVKYDDAELVELASKVKRIRQVPWLYLRLWRRGLIA